MEHLDSKSTQHHDASMRTTVTLEPDVAAKLKELAHRRRASFKETLNDVLRKGLNSQAGTREPPERYVVQPHAGGFRPGIDPDKLNQLVDELEVGDFVAGARPAE
jgi:mRNA-degrading endonuclease RelE of RelBE toxin-antitoxin system